MTSLKRYWIMIYDVDRWLHFSSHWTLKGAKQKKAWLMTKQVPWPTIMKRENGKWREVK